MKILVVDNEANTRESIVQLIENFCPFESEIYEANGVITGLKAIAEIHPDILFLDVELDDGTGMDCCLNLLKLILMLFS